MNNTQTNKTIVNRDERILLNGMELPNNNLNIFIGTNNCGKTNILMYINETFGNESDYISPQRLNVSNTPQFIEDIDQSFDQWRNSRKRKDINTSEIPGPNPTIELATLDNINLEKLLKWHKGYFAEIHIDKDENYQFKTPQILIEGRKPSEQGSGSRAVFSLLVKLFDPRLKALCIDEPEISVEPQTQRRLFQLLKLVSEGAEGLPQKRIFIATHSHLFIDKDNCKNNYKAYKENGKTKIVPVQNAEELSEIVFRLLGNSPGDIFFPSNVIIVEGESDAFFLLKVLDFIKPDSTKKRSIRIHYADGDSKIYSATKSIDQMLKSVSYTPVYRDKLCVVFDKQNSQSIIKEVKIFLKDDGNRVLELSKPGIEYFYPKIILTEITGIDNSGLENEIEKYLTEVNANHEGRGQFGKFNGTKIELAKAVVDRLTSLDGVDEKIIKLLQEATNRAFE